MGYLTDYTVRIVEGEGDINDIRGSLDHVSHYGFGVYNGEAYVSGVKWYRYEDDMRAVSAQFPGLLLEVEGSGEDYPDIWAQRFCDGKAGQRVKAEISFPGIGHPR